MARRSPARLLAPLALVGFVIALIVVINSSSTGGGSSSASGSRPAATTATSPSRKQKGAHKQRRRYTVKPGDTPSGIAEKTGVPLSKILELNPNLDDQSLTVGDKLKLR
jgi:LysM repeat protein